MGAEWVGDQIYFYQRMASIYSLGIIGGLTWPLVGEAPPDIPPTPYPEEPYFDLATPSGTEPGTQWTYTFHHERLYIRALYLGQAGESVDRPPGSDPWAYPPTFQRVIPSLFHGSASPSGYGLPVSAGLRVDVSFKDDRGNTRASTRVLPTKTVHLSAPQALGRFYINNGNSLIDPRSSTDYVYSETTVNAWCAELDLVDEDGLYWSSVTIRNVFSETLIINRAFSPGFFPRTLVPPASTSNVLITRSGGSRAHFL